MLSNTSPDYNLQNVNQINSREIPINTSQSLLPPPSGQQSISLLNQFQQSQGLSGILKQSNQQTSESLFSPTPFTQSMQNITPVNQTSSVEEDEAISKQYMSEMGTEEQLSTFFDRYGEHQGISSKCALDGRYFWKVLAPYPGLISSELYIRINQGELMKDPKDGTVREFEALDPVIDKEEFFEKKDAPSRYRLIKFIIDINTDPSDNSGPVHSNLIYIDTKKKEIHRFEPMFDRYYTEPINSILEDFFEELLPGYKFEMLNEHPQLPETESCPSKGMCAAYVLKKAMMLVTGNDKPLNGTPDEEEIKILHFSDAIEIEYGPLPSNEEQEFGFSIGFGIGGSPIPPYAPYPSPYYPYGPGHYGTPSVGVGFYSPAYYGYRFGRRFARRPGWGWGRGRRRRSFGDWNQEEYGAWEKTRAKWDVGYGKAKEKIGQIKQKGKEYFRKEAPQEQFKPQQAGVWDQMKLQESEKARQRFGVNYIGRDVPKQEYGWWNKIKDKVNKKKEVNQQPETQWEPSETNYANSRAQHLLDRYGSDVVPVVRKEYGHGGYRCRCPGCKTAPPRGEFGYWDRNEYGHRKWSKMEYGGAGSEYGCGCAHKGKYASSKTKENSEFGLNPNTWSPTTQRTVAGGAIGTGLGLLLGGGIKGALIGGGLGLGAGYLLSKAGSGRRQRYYYDRPSPQHSNYEGYGYY